MTRRTPRAGRGRSARIPDPREAAIPTSPRKPRPAGRAAKRAADPRPRRTSPRRKARPRAEQPLGVGVADAYAVKRLRVPEERRRGGRQVREVGWAEFGDMSKALADRVAGAFRPDVVLGIVNGGVFLGGALAAALRADFHALHVEKDGQRRTVAEPPAGVAGRAVLVVDDVIVSGVTMGAAVRAARKAGARDVRSATLVARPRGEHPDFHALETDELVVFGWDYQLSGPGAAGGDPGDFGV